MSRVYLADRLRELDRERVNDGIGGDRLVEDLVAEDEVLVHEVRRELLVHRREVALEIVHVLVEEVGVGAQRGVRRVAVPPGNAPFLADRHHGGPRRGAVLAEVLRPAVLVEIEQDVEAVGANLVQEGGDRVEIGGLELPLLRFERAPVHGEAENVHAAPLHEREVGGAERGDDLANRLAVVRRHVEQAVHFDVVAAEDDRASLRVAQDVAVGVERVELSDVGGARGNVGARGRRGPVAGAEGAEQRQPRHADDVTSVNHPLERA